MKVLVVADRYPYPLQNGQNLRIFHYVKQLQNQHVFDLVCYGDNEIPAQIESMFRDITTFSKPQIRSSQKASYWSRVRKMFSVEEMAPKDATIEKYLCSHAVESQYDLLWLSGWDLVTSVPASLNIPMLADIVDDGVIEHWREMKQAKTLAQFLMMAKRLWMNFRFERRFFCPADQVLLVSDVDAQSFSRICRNTPVSVINNGVDEEFFRPMKVVEKTNSIVFEGSMNFRPNVDGMIHFCQTTFPLVRKILPDVRLYIVGKDPPKEIRDLASEEIVITGYVEDIRPYLADANVFVCPLRKGTGIKNKILQAWAMGKTVIATSVSVGGLQAINGQNIVVCDKPEEFAVKLAALLDDEENRRSIGEEARKTILEHYTWSKKAQELDKLMQKVVHRHGVRHRSA